MFNNTINLILITAFISTIIFFIFLFIAIHLENLKKQKKYNECTMCNHFNFKQGNVFIYSFDECDTNKINASESQKIELIYCPTCGKYLNSEQLKANKK